MNHQAWLAALASELHRHGVDRELAGHVVAEAAAHLHDSGEPPMAVFGNPAAYATDVVRSVGGPAHLPRRTGPGPVRLDVRDVSKRYRRRTVLDRVRLTVRAGEIAAIVGANGSGKSTLLRICAGLASPDSGSVRVHGTFGYCPQDGGTADFLHPDEHFTLVGAGRRLTRAQSRAAGRAQAAVLDWDAATEVQARHLSGGTRQKLNLVLAGLGDPDLLLLDEPYQGFDRGTYLDFWHQVWRWRDAGKAIVVVTHLLNQLDRVDRVLDLTGKADSAGQVDHTGGVDLTGMEANR
ncbi:ATP-binding cassette domain-containing protein [Micromonospora sp. NBC_01813]|uniref:ATP-binding cassette domain-containing protein n=1 Tax=Micromonospora sp. NBC_01813 TaxID=2975988 RepID=UPI002DDA6F05|nr:ATP-binding cassette domain-containing protein [Micromonospora sp. NBC_01813]WSA11951.1 ATP-binding cassette domain-containing protein [Micromonospora sp. NBC_01813]